MAAVDPWQLQADPEWAVAIVIAAVDYAVVVRTFGRRGSPTPAWRRCCFAAGLALIAIGLLSPLEHIALTSLLAAHLLQNVMLADWAPPLLVLGLTPAMMAAAEKRAWVRAATAPPVALTSGSPRGTRCTSPRVYGYALEHRWALGLEHLAFLASGLAFWWAVISPGRMRPHSRLLFLFGAFIAAAPVSFALALHAAAVRLLRARTEAVGALAARGSADRRASGWRSSRRSSCSPRARSRSCSGWTRMRPRAGR